MPTRRFEITRGVRRIEMDELFRRSSKLQLKYAAHIYRDIHCRVSTRFPIALSAETALFIKFTTKRDAPRGISKLEDTSFIGGNGSRGCMRERSRLPLGIRTERNGTEQSESTVSCCSGVLST